MDGLLSGKNKGWMTAALVFAALADVDAHHAVLRFNLEEMTVTADRIFIGRCVALDPREELIAGGELPVTRYTFEVEQVLKGELAATFTFTQLGHPARAAQKGEPSMHGEALQTGLVLHGAADISVGNRLLMFLIPDYQGGRLTYPVGLDQGAFMVETEQGQVVARNNLNNLGLLTAPFNGTRIAPGNGKVVHPEESDTISRSIGVSDAARALADARGALALGPLVELVQKIHEAHGGANGRLLADGNGGR